MGANQDAVETAKEFNISGESALTFNKKNIKEAFFSASNAISRKTQNIEFSQTERNISNC